MLVTRNGSILSTDPVPDTVLRQWDKIYSCCGSTLLSDNVLSVMRIAGAKFVSDKTKNKTNKKTLSDGVCRTAVHESESGHSAT